MKISIITSVYNNKEQIQQAIESVLSQTYNDIEYIIIDAGSTDGTIEVIESYGDCIDVFISEKDDGIYAGLNKGIKLSTGDVVCFLHSDDFYLHNKVVEKVMKKFEENDCDGVHGDLIYVDKNDTDRVIRHWNSGEFDYESLKDGWMPPHPALFLKRKVYENFGLFDTNFKIAADYNFMLKILSSKKIKACYLPNVLYVMRLGGVSNNSLKNIFRKSKEDLRAIKLNNMGSFFVLLKKNFFKISQFFKR